jgi:glutaredoxin
MRGTSGPAPRLALGLLLVAAVSLGASGCRRSRVTSPELSRALAHLETTISDTLDPSLSHPAFDAVEVELRAVPRDAPDHARAVAFAEQIATARAARRARDAELLVHPGGGEAQSPLVLYSTAWCGYCKRAKAWLEHEKVPFVEKDIERDEAAARELKDKAERAGVQLRGVPVFDVDGQLVLGFQKDRIEGLLKLPPG